MRSLDFRIDDCVFRFDTNNEVLLKEANHDFAHSRCPTGLPASKRARAIETEETFPVEVPKQAVRDSFGPNSSAIFTHTNRRYVRAGDNCIFEIDLNGTTLEGYFRPEYTVWTLLRSMLKWFVIKNLEGKGIPFLHASAALRDDLSAILVAPSGFGKTSALLSLLQHDYVLVTDDVVLLDDETIHPFHMRSMIHSDMPGRFPLLSRALDAPSSSRTQGGWHVDLEDLFPAVHEPFVPQKTTLIRLYVWNSPDTEWNVLTSNQMAASMCHSYLMELSNSLWFGWNKEQVTKQVFNAYFDLSTRASCYEVHAGWDIQEFERAFLSLMESEEG